MLRELQVTMNKPANTMYKSGEDKIITGMAVVKNESNKTFEFAAIETAADLFFVDKERVATGADAAREVMSDYDVNYMTLVTNEPGKLIAFYNSERFATDQFDEVDLVTGVRVSAGVDGKIKKSTVASRYVFKGFAVDNGHKLAIVEVSDTANTNA